MSGLCACACTNLFLHSFVFTWPLSPPGKPSPPSKVWIRKNTSEYFRYDIMWTPVDQSHDYTINNYIIQTLALYNVNTANFCSCTQEYGDAMFPFQAGCPGFSLNHQLYYRVAVNTNIGQSNFMNGPHVSVVAGKNSLYVLVYFIHQWPRDELFNVCIS